MNCYELKKLHSLLLLIMCEIDKICKNYNLKYSLWAGSLIGAIRHNGFIPWDDDLDIAMPRDDYEKFCMIFKNIRNTKFSLVSLDDHMYGYGFSKVILNGTRIEQLGVKNGKNLEIWVDIFPYDNIPNSKFGRILQKSKNYFFMKLLEEKYDGIYGKKNPLKFLGFKFLHLLNLVINDNWSKLKLDNNMKKYDKIHTSHISCLSSPYGYYKEILPSDFFNDICEHKFEDYYFSIFNEYDFYLKKIYGDYMKLPPIEKRHVHNLVIHDFGEYD